MLTTEQVRTRIKTVTRRIGWQTLQPGTLLQPVVKSQGLRRGEQVERIGGPIRVVNVRRERLDTMAEDEGYGRQEVKAEGFEGHPEHGDPSAFCAMFSDHNRCGWGQVITRIEFEYLPHGDTEPGSLAKRKK